MLGIMWQLSSPRPSKTETTGSCFDQSQQGLQAQVWLTLICGGTLPEVAHRWPGRRTQPANALHSCVW